jgi:hypothetical protein
MLKIPTTGSEILNLVRIILLGSSIGLLPACRDSASKEDSDSSIAPAAIGAVVGAAVDKGVPIGDFLYKVITESMERAKKDSNMKADRAAFISSMTEEVYQKMNRQASKDNVRPYNIAICAGDLQCSLNADEGIHYAVKTFNFQDRNYTLWAFRGGKLNNPTNGGWDNWRLMGCHDHTSGQGARTVNFANTTWIGKAADGKIGCVR